MSEGHVNFLGGSPLNRLSWLRPSSVFINTLLALTSTRWVAFHDGKPLMASRASVSRLARLTTAEVGPFLGPKPYFGQGPPTGSESTIPAIDLPILQAARFKGAPAVFLGVSEPQANVYCPSVPPEEFAKSLVGIPFFSIDLSQVDQTELDRLIQTSAAATDGFNLCFDEARSAALHGMDEFDAAVFAEARSMVDWNSRNKFCASCGSHVYSVWGGWKLSCASLLSSSDNTGRKPCPTHKGLHNITHPRTDAAVIVAILNEKQDKILLGRNKKFPPKFYSTLAGFVEPGESFEDAVKREIWEEAGIHVRNVRYHSGQPWPYPANLMVGFYAIGDPLEPIRTDLDNELEDAKWCTREEILAILEHKNGTSMSRSHFKQMARSIDEKDSNPLGGDAAVQDSESQAPSRNAPDPVADGNDEPAFRVGPRTAIAGVLISDWAFGKVPAEIGFKGRM